MNAVVGCEEVVDLNNNSGDLDALNGQPNLQRESFATSEKQEGPVATLEEQESVSNLKKIGADFSIPLSIFHYKGYGSDFFTSWYNISSEIFKEINRACLEKKVLNSALSVLMFPYVASVALGLVIYKTNSKTQTSSEESKTKKSEVSTAKRLAYGVLAAIAILVDIAVLIALIIPATPALATFYLTNRKLSHSLVAALKISNGLYQNEHQNIEVSFREIDAGKLDIKWDMEVKFPPQFEQLLRDLYEDKDGSWFNVARDSEHNTILKLSANINLKNGLRPLRNEIKNVLAISIQEFAKTMEELMKLEGKDITYDKLKELLNEFRLKVVDSVDSKLVNYLIQNAYRVAFIQAIKFAQKRREEKEDFSLEERLKEVLVEQELKSQGKELPTEKEMILEDLKKAGAKVPDDLDDRGLPMFKAKWKQLIKEGKIAERTIINTYEDMYPQETKKALDNAEREIKDLREIGQKRYNGICEKLKEMHKNRKNGNLKDGALKRKLEDLFKFEYDDQKVEERLIESRIRTINTLLSKSDKKIKQSLAEDFSELKETRTSDKVNDFVEKMYLEITRCRIQELFEKQGESIKNVEDNKDMLFNGEDEKRLVNKIVSYRKEIGEYFTQPTRLKEIIGKQNEDLDVEKNSKEEKSSSMELIELCLRNNQEILEALEQLELKKEGLLINEETKNNYREELESREKIKFAIIEDDLLKAFEHETFNEEAIKRLLEEAELEYYLAERCIKYPVIKTKDNIKHFCQDLLSPLVDRLANLIINNVPKDNGNSLWKIWNSLKVGFNYNVIGWSATVNKDKSTEGKALSVAHDTHKEIETFLQHFESSYEEVGALIGDVFSDDGKTFKNDVWPKVEEHLHGMWNRFFKDVEFKIGNRLDEVSVTQQKQNTMIVTQ
ncbi:MULTISPECIES: hypothetical protein [unclassified Wolbachia]|uniref:hypothetical protein n=1 Tax=unclassified Wolbachia TaxID=2640676 RepID=UPI00222F6799|nr:hypothetical protein [Wolbachia endosymbiont (group A) of Macropis europaea]